MKLIGKVELFILGLFLCNFWYFFFRVLVEFFFKCVSDNKNIKFMFVGIKMFWVNLELFNFRLSSCVRLVKIKVNFY